MNAAAWFLLGAALAFLGLFAVVYAEVHHLYAERDRLRRDLRIVRGQRDLADSERAELQARLDAKVLPFGPVQTGVVKRIPGQRKGGGA
jgi:hypothetical protein